MSDKKELRMKMLLWGLSVIIFALMGIYLTGYQHREAERESLLNQIRIESIPIEETQMEAWREGKEEAKRMATDEIRETEEETGFVYHEEIPLDVDYQEHIHNECKRLGVNEAYMLALIETESSFIPGQLVSDGGGQSIGLCQINSVNWGTMEEMGLDYEDEFDCITFAVTLIAEYLDKYDGSTNLMDVVTTCYKAGESGARKLAYHLDVCEEIEERTNYYNELLNGGN